MKSPESICRGRHFSPSIGGYTVWMYHRFRLSLRDVEDLLAERGGSVSYETIRAWCKHYGPTFANRIRKQRGRCGDTWYLAEVQFVTVPDERCYLWRAVDQDGDTIDILVQKRKDKRVADKLPSYAAVKREMMPGVPHWLAHHAHHRCEVSHQHTQEQERQMRKFKSPGQRQRFLSVYGQIQNLFRHGRYLTTASAYRFFRARALFVWQTGNVRLKSGLPWPLSA